MFIQWKLIMMLYYYCWSNYEKKNIPYFKLKSRVQKKFRKKFLLFCILLLQCCKITLKLWKPENWQVKLNNLEEYGVLNKISKKSVILNNFDIFNNKISIWFKKSIYRKGVFVIITFLLKKISFQCFNSVYYNF